MVITKGQPIDASEYVAYHDLTPNFSDSFNMKGEFFSGEDEFYTKAFYTQAGVGTKDHNFYISIDMDGPTPDTLHSMTIKDSIEVIQYSHNFLSALPSIDLNGWFVSYSGGSSLSGILKLYIPPSLDIWALAVRLNDVGLATPEADYVLNLYQTDISMVAGDEVCEWAEEPFLSSILPPNTSSFGAIGDTAGLSHAKAIKGLYGKRI